MRIVFLFILPQHSTKPAIVQPIAICARRLFGFTMYLMKFSELSKYLAKLEATSKRLEITDILTSLIKELSPEETKEAVYLILGRLKAPFEDQKFNIADKMAMRLLEAAYSSPQKIISLQEIDKLYHKAGDLGNTVLELADKNKKSSLTILEVYSQLMEIAKVGGGGSQDGKVKKGAALLKELDPLSAKFVIRIILGTTRLGFSELTFMDALAQDLGDKKLSDKIERVYNIHPDIGLIAKNLKTHGLKGLSEIKVQAGVPIISQRCQRLSSAEEAIEKMKLVWAEYKFDGTRVQLHFNKGIKIKSNNDDQVALFDSAAEDYLIQTYTRNLEASTHQYPDLVAAAKKQIAAKSVILDGEAIGYDKTTGRFLPFQETIQRKRKHDVASSVANIPLKYFVFDILYLNGEGLVDKTLRERKALLKSIIKPGDTIVVDEYLETSDADELHDYYTKAINKGLEGLVVKTPEDPYQAGARSYSWCKLKKSAQKLMDDSVDCVVLGYYVGRGGRSKFGIGGFLAGVLDEKKDKIVTITKVGTGLTDEEFGTLKKMCDKLKVTKLPTNVEMDKIYEPDVMVSPKIVLELTADEISDSPTHTAGYALRFPRLLRFREDKSVSEITTVKEITQMYKKQKTAGSELN
jgi:DNA ligase 1